MEVDASQQPIPVPNRCLAMSPRRWAVLGFLLALSLLPRLAMAWQLEAVCHDAYYYVAVAEALERGDHGPLFEYLNLNLYPFLLLAGHRLGLDWLTAGKLWGAVAASLAVLPLHGWIRRLFDERIAFAAGLLYALHPGLIELSVEPIREATFWLCFTLAVYLMVRAVRESRLSWYALAGFATALAIHTRSEGWLLLLPAICWTGSNFTGGWRKRFRAAFGTGLLLATTPLLLLAVNLSWLHDHPRWEWGRLAYFQHGWHWLIDDAPSASSKLERDDPSRAKPPTSVAEGLRRAKTYFRKLVETLEPINGILLLIGLGSHWSHILRRERFALTLIAFALLASVWFLMWQWVEVNGRYFYTVYLVAVPLAGVGLLRVMSVLSALVARRFPRIGLRPVSLAVPAAVLGFLAVVFWTDALSTTHERRASEAALGLWLRDRFGPFDSVVVDRRSASVGYFSRNDAPAMFTGATPLARLIEQRKPDLVILDAEAQSFDFPPSGDDAGAPRFEPLDPRLLPETGNRFLVLVPRRAITTLATNAPAG